MKKLALTAISLLIAGSASAADLRPMPVKAAPAPVAVAAYNWTGCYVGAGGGYGMFDQEVTAVSGGVPVGVHNDVGGRGWFGTVQVGCDYQVGSNIVIGAFGDYDFSGIQGEMGLVSVANVVGEEKQKYSRAAGGRIGWLPFQAQLLVFVSGGYTQTQFDQVNFVSTIGPPANLAAAKHTYSGWFIGSGYEYGVAFLPGLFWKTEYRFADYGTEQVALLDGAGVPQGDFMESRKYIQTIRSALVWRFNFGGPVVARY
jgi:outer membrane immunogenic protein